jgi:hypothetical protein
MLQPMSQQTPTSTPEVKKIPRYPYDATILTKPEEIKTEKSTRVTCRVQFQDSKDKEAGKTPRVATLNAFLAKDENYKEKSRATLDALLAKNVGDAAEIYVSDRKSTRLNSSH